MRRRRRRARRRRPPGRAPTTSWTGWRVPTSWLAHWQCTRAGRGSDARPESLPEGVDVEPTRAVHADLLDRRDAGRGVADGGVLHGGTEHRRARGGPGRAPDGRVDRLGRPRREDHLARARHRPGRRPAGAPPRVRRARCGPLRGAGPGSPGGRVAPSAPARQSPRAGPVSCWRGRGRRAPRGLRRRRCRCRRPAPARR